MNNEKTITIPVPDNLSISHAEEIANNALGNSPTKLEVLLDGLNLPWRIELIDGVRVVLDSADRPPSSNVAKTLIANAPMMVIEFIHLAGSYEALQGETLSSICNTAVALGKSIPRSVVYEVFSHEVLPERYRDEPTYTELKEELHHTRKLCDRIRLATTKEESDVLAMEHNERWAIPREK